MSDTDRAFTGSIPEIYDTYLGPLVFEPYATDMAERVAALAPVDVLETAAGSGVVARALASLLGSTRRYVVTDLNQAMLDYGISRQPGDDLVTWRQADALQLPFEDASFDVVFCQFGAMFFPDRIAGYREARRVLKPGGRFLFSVWDAIEHSVMTDVIVKAAAEIFPEDPPAFLARTPHGYHDVGRIEADLRAAGFSDITITTLALQAVAASPRDPAIGFCQGSPMRAEIVARDPQGLERVTDHAARALAKAFGEGPISGKMQAHVIVAGG
jgi:ubiquinone/menaquinone biosynthesis C-methylase UbiE